MITRNRFLYNNFDISLNNCSRKINVGEKFQANLPSFLGKPSFSQPDTNIAVWIPGKHFGSDEELNEFIKSAKFDNGFSEEQSLALLMYFDGDFLKTRRSLDCYARQKDNWTREEALKFFLAITFHKKNFNQIKKLFIGKNFRDLVKFYYLNKRHNFLRDLGLDRVISGSDHQPPNKFENIPLCIKTKYGPGIRKIQQKLVSNPIKRNHNFKDHPLGPKVEKCLRQKARINQYTNLDTQYKKSKNKRGRIPNLPTKIAPDIDLNLTKKEANNYSMIYLKEFQKDFNLEKFELERRKDFTEIQTEQFLFDEKHAKELKDFKMNSNIIKRSKKLTNKYLSMDTLIKKTPLNPSWNSEEIKFAIQETKRIGNNFSEIAESLGTKTEGMVRDFFCINSQKYGLDKLLSIREQEKQK